MRQPFLWSMRLAARNLLRARGTTTVAMFTLAIGLSAAVALLGVIDSGARALPVPGGDHIIELEVRNARAERVQPPAPVAEWTRVHGIDDAGALRMTRATLTHASAPAQRAYGAAMHASVLHLLQVAPALGRIPTADARDATAIVLGWDLWQLMGGDIALLGTRLDVDGQPHTIIGVMPENFGFPERQSYWTVLPAHETGEVVARVARATRIETAVQTVQARLAAHAPELASDGPLRVSAQRWTTSRDNGGEGVALAALGTLVLLLLLVCAANVATLLLVRGNERAGVLAVHAALGATRVQVTTQLFLECTIIAVGGGVLGLMGGFAMLRWMQLNLSQHWGYYWMTMEVRAPVLIATFALVLVTALLAGTVPSLRAGRIDLARVLVGSGRSRHDPAQRRLGRWFVGAQVMMSTLGLVAALVLAWQFSRFGNLDERLPVDDVAIGSIVLPADRYQTDLERAALHTSVRAQLARIPGVIAVSITGAVPGGSSGTGRLERAGVNTDAATTQVSWVAGDAAMTAVYEMRTLAGRTFDERDNSGSTLSVLVTSTVARDVFAGDAVGQSVRITGLHPQDRWAEIVGVVEDWFPEQPGRPVYRVFVPIDQAASDRLYFSLDTDATPSAVLGAVRAAVARVDARLPVDELQTLAGRMNYATRMYRVIAAFGILGGIASAVVAGIGLYGVMSFQVRTRRREIAVRMALGAARSRVVVEVLRESVLRVAPGLVAGLVVALSAVPLLRSSQAAGNVTNVLLLTSVVVAVLLLLVGVGAAVEPAWRASRLDPQQVLRAD